MIRQETKVGTRGELARELKRMLRLRTTPVAYRRQDRAEDLDQLKSLQGLPHLIPFCQSLFMARGQEVPSVQPVTISCGTGVCTSMV
jgi:uncharacterized protein (DUF169 family)